MAALVRPYYLFGHGNGIQSHAGVGRGRQQYSRAVDGGWGGCAGAAGKPAGEERYHWQYNGAGGRISTTEVSAAIKNRVNATV